MEIKNYLNQLDPYNRTKLSETKAQNAKREASAATAATSESGDRISLSSEAKLRTEAYTAAMSAPDVRQEKIDALKAKVASGEYLPDSNAIAAKLLSEEPGLFLP